MLEPYEPTPGIHVLPSFVPLGPLGMVPVNAYLVTGPFPYLVDTGLMLDRDSFVQAVTSMVDVQELSVNGRRLTVAKPPIFDAQETTAVYDGELEVLFSADSFGAPLTELKTLANDIPADELTEKEKIWASFDSPWVHQIDRQRFALNLKQFVNADPLWVMGPRRRMASRSSRRPRPSSRR